MSRRTIRQVSAGGAVLRRHADAVEVCLIRRDRHGQQAWGLPKGHLESGEDAAAAAMREVREETGLQAEIVRPLTSIQYTFTLPGDPVSYDKTVHFFLMRARGGDLQAHDTEVCEARWMSLDAARQHATYANEQRVLDDAAQLAQQDEVRAQLEG